MDHYSILGVAISVTLVGVVMWGSIMGAMLPFLLKRCGLDPAGSSTPFVATLVDVTGIVIYFTVAIIVLRSTLLRPDLPGTQVHTEAIVTVVAVDNFRPGDDEVELTVQTDAQKGTDRIGRVTIPVKGLKGDVPPHVGDRLRLEFDSSDAAGARPTP